MIYIASPYSGDTENRYLQALKFTAEELKAGNIVYSPIVHCHEIARVYEMPTSFDFWQHYNRGMIESSKELWVLMLDGWDKSVGVMAEIAFARSLKIPVKFIKV